MNLVKAEILWTRQCPLKCSYCSMADGRKNELSLDEWKHGMINLKAMGCNFAAFYGAEPLYDRPEDLAEVVGFAESIGIHTTVITSGVVPNVNEIVEMLYRKGARSLSTSYDIEACHKHAQVKTDKAIPLLKHFQSLGPYRDVAAIATIGEHNFSMMPEAVMRLTKENIWFLFDILHPDRHQPGSKCSGSGEPYLLKSWDMFAKILNVLIDLKAEGYLCHASKPFMKFLQFLSDQRLRVDHMFTSWNCGLDPLFPGWVTVDCDGLVYPCVPDMKSSKIYFADKEGTARPSEIKEGDQLIGYDESNHKFVPTTVTKVHKRKAEGYFRITCKIGNRYRTLFLTGEHPILTQRGWVKTKDLLTTDKIYTMPNRFSVSLRTQSQQEFECTFCGKSFIRYKPPCRKEGRVFCSRKCAFNWASMKQKGFSCREDYLFWRKEKNKPTYCSCGCGRVLSSPKAKFSSFCRGKNKDAYRAMGEVNKRKGKWVGDKNPMRNLVSKNKILSNPNYKKSRWRAIVKAIQNKKKAFPSILEKRLIHLIEKHLLPIRYTGNGTWWRNKMNPDFKVNGQNKVIETTNRAFRDINKYTEERTAAFAKEGIDCLVLDMEKNSDDQLVALVRKFINNGSQVVAVQYIENEIMVYNYSCKPYNNYVVNGFVTHNCDDFQPRIYGEDSPITITNLYTKIDEFRELWKPIVRTQCPGCLWNTHFDTFEILMGKVPFSDYVHTNGTKRRQP